MLRALPILFAASVLVACGGPKTAHEALVEGNAALKAGQTSRARKMYTLAFEKADQIGNGSQVKSAADHLVELAVERADYATVQRLYDHLLKVYPGTVGGDPYPFRIQNNLAVAESRLGRQDRARTLLREAADFWKTKPYASVSSQGLHMLLLRNLAKVHEAEGWGPEGDLSYQELLRVAEWLRQSRSPTIEPVARTLKMYAGYLRASGRADAAADLESRAQAVDPSTGRNDPFQLCSHYTFSDGRTSMKYCYLELE